jgi:hypothetical protein
VLQLPRRAVTPGRLSTGTGLGTTFALWRSGQTERHGGRPRQTWPATPASARANLLSEAEPTHQGTAPCRAGGCSVLCPTRGGRPCLGFPGRSTPGSCVSFLNHEVSISVLSLMAKWLGRRGPRKQALVKKPISSRLAVEALEGRSLLYSSNRNSAIRRTHTFQQPVRQPARPIPGSHPAKLTAVSSFCRTRVPQVQGPPHTCAAGSKSDVPYRERCWYVPKCKNIPAKSAA